MIHETAIVDPGARLHESVEVGPWSLIGPNVEIGEGTTEVQLMLIARGLGL